MSGSVVAKARIAIRLVFGRDRDRQAGVGEIDVLALTAGVVRPRGVISPTRITCVSVSLATAAMGATMRSITRCRPDDAPLTRRNQGSPRPSRHPNAWSVSPTAGLSLPVMAPAARSGHAGQYGVDPVGAHSFRCSCHAQREPALSQAGAKRWPYGGPWPGFAAVVIIGPHRDSACTCRGHHAGRLRRDPPTRSGSAC